MVEVMVGVMVGAVMAVAAWVVVRVEAATVEAAAELDREGTEAVVGEKERWADAVVRAATAEDWVAGATVGKVATVAGRVEAVVMAQAGTERQRA